MDAVVLAGGYATRLWPITRYRPKMLLPVGETTPIDRILSTLETDDRIDTVYVSTNETFAELIQEYIEDREYQKAQLSVEASREEAEKFGVVGALAQLCEREDITRDLLVIAGDNIIDFEIADFIDYFEERDSPVLAAYDVDSRERAQSYGIVELDGDQVVDFQEKPRDPKSTLVAIACYAFPAEALRFQDYLSGENNPDEPGWYIQWLQSRDTVYAFTFDGVWFDIGTPKSYFEAVKWALDGESLIHPEATLKHCTVGETVHVMQGAEVTDTELETTIVFPDAEINNCYLDESILGEDVHIEGLEMGDALVSEVGLANR